MTAPRRDPAGRGRGEPLAGRRVLFLVTEDWYFWSHRRPLAQAAQAAGATVAVAARMAEHRDRIAAAGWEPIDIPFDRSGIAPWRDARTLRAILRAYRVWQPDLVHHVALKPVLYGSLAARLARVPAVVNAITGLGYVFVSEGMKARLIRLVARPLLGLANRGAQTRLVVQNEDDRALCRDAMGVADARIVLVPGAGVDVARFQPQPSPPTPPVVAVCVARMLWDKGIGELVEAARALHRAGVPLRVRLVGGTDRNPASIPEATLAAWRAEGIVDVAGHRSDIAAELAAAHVAVLPSYREGLPKALLEAAAAGLPLVAADTPGCRDVCIDGRTGLLVPARDAEALAAALHRLATDAALRARLGARARALAVDRFAEARIAAETLAIYRDLLEGQDDVGSRSDDAGRRGGRWARGR